MIEYYLNTGTSPNPDNYYNDGSISASRGSITSNDVVTNHVTVNGVTLLETIPEISVVAQTEIVNNTGDFFLSGFSLKDGTGYYDFGDMVGASLQYDVVSSGEHPFFSGESFTGMITGFTGEVGSTLGSDLVFVNGIKLTSGDHYFLAANGEFVWNDSEDLSGMMFSMPNDSEDYNYGQYDLFNRYFNAGTSVGYLNGVKLDNKDFLETSSIVESIEIGLEPSINFTGATSSVISF